jgi:hypothetical protein
VRVLKFRVLILTEACCRFSFVVGVGFAKLEVFVGGEGVLKHLYVLPAYPGFSLSLSQIV